jgi:hypothetical protein
LLPFIFFFFDFGDSAAFTAKNDHQPTFIVIFDIPIYENKTLQ